MKLVKRLILGGTLISSLTIASGCSTSDKEWKKFIEKQSVCELKVKKNDSYWRIAERLRICTKFEYSSRGWLGQKLENYQNNPLNKDLRIGMKIKIPCNLSYQ